MNPFETQLQELASTSSAEEFLSQLWGARQQGAKPRRYHDRGTVIVVNANPDQVVAVGKTLDHLFERSSIPRLHISLRIPCKTFAKRFSFNLQIMAQCIFGVRYF